MVQQSNTGSRLKMRQNPSSINDIKWDPIPIIEPRDGRLENKPRANKSPNFSKSYSGDPTKQRKIPRFPIVGSIRDTAITYDVAIKISDPVLRNLRYMLVSFNILVASKEAA